METLWPLKPIITYRQVTVYLWLPGKGNTMEHTILYRYFDSSGNLLYVGITKSQINRFSQHNAKSVWIPLIHSATFEHFQFRQDAIEAESRAIENEDPKYNIAGSRNDKGISIINMHFLSLYMKSPDQHDIRHHEFAKAIQQGATHANPDIDLSRLLTATEFIATCCELTMAESKGYANLTDCAECIRFFESEVYANALSEAKSEIAFAIYELTEAGQNK
jgi:predicted GIY-YIG superfamily endonuclease